MLSLKNIENELNLKNNVTYHNFHNHQHHKQRQHRYNLKRIKKYISDDVFINDKDWFINFAQELNFIYNNYPKSIHISKNILVS